MKSIESLNKDNDISILILLNLFIRNKKFIFIFTTISILFSFTLSLFSKKIWEGEFQIVINKEDNKISDNFLLNQQLSNIEGLSGLNSNNNILRTELEILQSPSVLMPIFEYVKNQKFNDGIDVEKFLFSSWKKNNLDLDLKKGTSVMLLKYNDENKDLIIPVLNKISREYQIYSGNNRRRQLELASEYLIGQVSKYKFKSSESFKKLQEFAFDKDLIVNEFNFNQFRSIDNVDTSSDYLKNNLFGSILDVEQVRVNSANKIKNINSQINKIEQLKDDVEKIQYFGSTIPALVATGLPKQLENLENQIVQLRVKYTENDKSLQRLYEKRILLIDLLKRRSIGFLKAERLATEALMEAATKPKSILIKYRELIREASRDEKTLIELENKLNFISLEKSRIKDPWELITKPTLNPKTINTSKKKIIFIGAVLGFLVSYLISSIREKISGFLYDKEILEGLLESKILDEINISEKAYESFNREIIQKEILLINNKSSIKVIFSEPLEHQDKIEILDLIFSNKSQYEVIESLDKLKVDEQLIFICKLSSIKIDEIKLLKKRLEIIDKKLFGIFLAK